MFRLISDTTGDQRRYLTIEAALTAADSGDTIVVEKLSNPVTTTITVNKEVKIVGNGSYPRFYRNNTSLDYVFHVTADNVQLIGLDIDQVNDGTNVGTRSECVRLDGNRGVIKDCICRNADHASNTLTNNILVNGDNCRVQNSVIKNSKYGGIRSNSGKYLVISDCQILNNEKLGIVHNSTGDGLVITGCTIVGHDTDPESSGILIDPGNNATIDKCTIANTNVELPAWDHTDGAGIKIENVQWIIVDNVTVEHPDAAGDEPSFKTQGVVRKVSVSGLQTSGRVAIGLYRYSCSSDGTTFTAIDSSNQLADGLPVALEGSDLPEPARTHKVYYVVNRTSTTCQISEQPNGTPIAFTDAGSGSMYISIVPDEAVFRDCWFRKNNSDTNSFYCSHMPRYLEFDNCVFDNATSLCLRLITVPRNGYVQFRRCRFINRGTGNIYTINGTGNVAYSGSLRVIDCNFEETDTGQMLTTAGVGSFAWQQFNTRDGREFVSTYTAPEGDVGYKQGDKWIEQDTGYEWLCITANEEGTSQWISWNASISNGNSGAAIDLDFRTGPIQTLVLDDDTTLTFTDPNGGPQKLWIVFSQDATGGRSVTWPTLDGNTPTVGTGSLEVNVVPLFYDGTTYHTSGN